MTAEEYYKKNFATDKDIIQPRKWVFQFAYLFAQHLITEYVNGEETYIRCDKCNSILIPDSSTKITNCLNCNILK